MPDDTYTVEQGLSPMPTQELTGYYRLPLAELITKAKDRYELVMLTARNAREINAARLRYGTPRPEKATVVALNEVLQGEVIEARKPEDRREATDDEEPE
jgi:DNA-directed RNA polymerase omega subunit